MAAVGGKRAAAAEHGRNALPTLFRLAGGITLSLLGWGYLVWIAIDFGAEARRTGNGAAWGLLLLAAIGAVACLFLAFLLVSRLLQTLGLLPGSPPPRDSHAPKGGKRAKR